MKKYLALGAIAAIVALQGYTNYKVSKTLDETELNNMLSESLSTAKAKAKELAGIEEINQAIDGIELKISSVSKNMGLFGSQARIEVDAGGVPVAINAEISHVLGSVSANGNIEPAQNELLELFEKFFNKQKPITYSYDGALSLNLAGFNLGDELGDDMKASFEPIGIKFDFDKKLAAFSVAGIEFDSDETAVSLKNFKTDITLFDADSSFKNYKSKGFASFDKLNLNLKKEQMNLSFDSMSAKNDAQVKNGSASANDTTNITKISVKSPFSDFEIDDLSLKISYKNLQSDDFKNPQSIFSKDSVIAFDELSFKLNGANISTKLNFGLKDNYTKESFDKLPEFLMIKGEFSTDRALSTALNLPLLAMIEEGIIKSGYLLKNNDGYKTSFEGAAGDLTFNGKTKLDLSKELRLR